MILCGNSQDKMETDEAPDLIGRLKVVEAAMAGWLQLGGDVASEINLSLRCLSQPRHI